MQINDRDKNTSYTEKFQYHIPCSFAYKVIHIDDKFSKPAVLHRRKNAVNRLIEAILEEYGYCKKVIKNHFNKNLVMSVEDERIFQASNKCWICKKLFTDEDKKVRDHVHITGKYRDSAHPNCNINLKLNKKIPAIFRNLRDYDGHLVMQ